MNISMESHEYPAGEGKLRELILNVCQQRHLSRSAELPGTAKNRRDYVAGMLTLVDEMSTDKHTGKFSGTMRFCYKGTVFLTAEYAGSTQPAVTYDLRRILSGGSISLPFRGTGRRLRHSQDDTISAIYNIKAVDGFSCGDRSFCRPDGRRIVLEERIVLKDGRSVGEEAHHCVIQGKIRISEEEMLEIASQKELLL